MAYWLVKSEPDTYSFDRLLSDGSTVWDGVRNFAARNHLAAMKKGDQVFFYHSNQGMAIVGVAKVSREAFEDPSDEEGKWVAVELTPIKRLPNAVSLSAIKSNIALSDMVLVRNSRLSVQPVSATEWKEVMKLAK